jgi:hypothetical protein
MSETWDVSLCFRSFERKMIEPNQIRRAWQVLKDQGWLSAETRESIFLSITSKARGKPPMWDLNQHRRYAYAQA